MLEVSKAEKPFDHKEILPSLFSDAWSIVDSIYRLRALLPMLPEAKVSEIINNFISATKEAHELRHSSQHLHDRIDSFVSHNEQAWGYITWITFDKYPEGRMHTVVSGSVAGKTHFSPANPIGKTVKKPLDHIALHLLNESVSLSQIKNEIETLASFLEQVLSGQFEGHPISPSAPYLVITFSVA